MKGFKKILYFVVFMACFMLFPFDTFAEGSRDLMAVNNNGVWSYNGGFRAYIEYNNSQYVGMDRKQLLKVYAERGETILLATSTYASTMNHEIEVLRPDGSTTYYDINTVDDVGLIKNTQQELAGPRQLGNDAGYESISFVATQTGIYEVTFYPYTDDSNANPAAIKAEEDWNVPNSGVGIAAWDITVAKEVNGVLTAINGRTFANYLTINTGQLTPADHRNGSVLNSKVYILTTDGYWYLTDFNGLDPYGFIFFANNRGMIDSESNTSFLKSVPFSYNTSTRVSHVYPSNIYFHLPSKDDSNIDKTYEIFFNTPDGYDTNSEEYKALPRSIYPLRVSPPSATGFRFTSDTGEGTTTEGVGGLFSFTKVDPRSDDDDQQDTDTFTFQIEIDFNNYRAKDGGDYDYVDNHYEKVEHGKGHYEIYNVFQYYNANTEITDFDNRVYLSNSGTSGENHIYWDGKDAMGRYVLSGTDTYTIKLELKSGEYHFPTIDVEHNIDGIKIELVNAEESDYATYLYYDNSIVNYNGFELNDETIHRYPSGKPGWIAEQPVKNLDGILGSEGILKYRYVVPGYGDNVVFDAWTYYKSDVKYESSITVNPAQGLGTISGLVFYDADANGKYDTFGNDYVLPNVSLTIINQETSKEYNVTTSAFGKYLQVVPTGTYTVKASSAHCTTNNYEQTNINVVGGDESFITNFNTEVEKEYQGVPSSPVQDNTFVTAADIGYQVVTNISTSVKLGNYDQSGSFVYFDENSKVMAGDTIYAEISLDNTSDEVAFDAVSDLVFSDGLDYVGYQKIGPTSQPTTYYAVSNYWQVGTAATNTGYMIRIELLVTETVGDKTLSVKSDAHCNDVETTLDDNTSTATITTLQSPYNVEIGAIINGTVTTDKATGFEGDVITINNITGDPGYELDTIKVTKIDGNVDVPINPDNTFVMPDGDVIITANFKKIIYNVVVSPTITDGVVTTSVDQASVFDVVKITITPNEGYELDTIKVISDGGVEITVTNAYEFEMPADNVTVYATFKPKPTGDPFNVIIDESIVNGIVTASKSEAYKDEVVTITSVTPSEGYELDTLTVKTISGKDVTLNSDRTFVMPDEDVIISATFKTIAENPYTADTIFVQIILFVVSILSIIVFSIVLTKKKRYR